MLSCGGGDAAPSLSVVRVRQLSLLVVIAFVAACSDSDGATGAESSVETPAASPFLDLIPTARWQQLGDDNFEVWVCHVPAGATATIYGGLPLRLDLTPADVIKAASGPVSGYFEELSHNKYRPVFTVGGELTMGVDDEPRVCIDRAIAAAGPDTEAVLVVADAEHGADQKGGFGSDGASCALKDPCPVGQSRRFAYVGASDFHPDWGDAPPMDLVEHEIGHTLGWPHSGVEADGRYLSALDLMSNSAAPREMDSARRDGPGTLAVNMLISGWIPPTDAWVAPPEGGAVTLTPSASAAGTRLAILPLDGGSFLTVELLVNDGLDAHLPTAGIAVHEVRVADDELQPIKPLLGEPPYTSLLQPGEVLDNSGWIITVTAEWSLSVAPHPPSDAVASLA